MTSAAANHESLANLSNTLVYAAMAVYTLAFLAHLAEWVLGSRSRVGRTAASLTVPAGASGAASRAVRQGGGTAVLERPVVVTRADGDRPGVPDGPGAAGSSARGDLYGRIAVSLTVLAFLLHLGGVLARAVSVERAPWANMYEYSTTFGVVVTGGYLLFLALGKDVRWMGLPLVTTVLLDLGLAVSVLYTDSDQLVPALRSYWLYIHVSCAILCGAFLYLGAITTLLYLLRDRYEARLTAEGGRRPGRFAASVLERMPAAASLDKSAYRVNALVFPLWTFTLIAGAIWAEAAWGRYWGWDAKEIWTLITWVAYASYLHARATAGWRGRKAAWLGLAAFGCYLFNYYGVNIFFNSLHAYSGV
ncbi:c-type cytochrome biogenesis protein CcsB [Streptomyces sp. URMC 126]|uniref:c-type cytochrome biogenesis protein CcsB n=1 Tax=Streptomyces sp. URMC 126 TaxID=3423401 RepID=UPI003F1A63CF